MHKVFDFLAWLHSELGFDPAVGEIFQQIADELEKNGW